MQATHMMVWNSGHSLSAPKYPARSDRSHSSSHSSLSPGVSPSLTAALNFPLSQGCGYFFNREVTVRELLGLGHIGEVLDGEESPRGKMGSKSAGLKAMSVTSFYESLREVREKPICEVISSPKPTSQPSPADYKESVPVRRDWADYSSGSNFTPSQSQQFSWEILPENSPKVPIPQSVPLPVSTVEEAKTPLLQMPPKKVRRAQRGTFESESVLSSRVRGTIKFYNLKKRFGFITQENDGSDVFLCEDDLILSEINHKKFKEEVAAGRKPRFEYSLKVYQDKNQAKKKAVSLVSLDD